MPQRKKKDEVFVAPGNEGDPVVVDVAAEDAYWSENYADRPYVSPGRGYAAYQPAYRYGVEASQRHQGRRFEDVEAELRGGWEKARGRSALAWDEARGATRDAFERTIQLREERLNVHKESVETGAVRLRKEVVTEQKTIDVPVEREEVVVERRKVSGRKAGSGDLKAEEFRVPVKQERVEVSKEAFVTEEVSVGKRKVADKKTVSADLKKEELRVEETGDAKVRGDKGKKK